MSQFIVSARKYRPQRFSDVIGQEHITTTLKNAIRQDKVAHAFLFCGPRGVGKTTTARILAKTINCDNITEDFEACGVCASCLAFQKKNTPNILELDAASHNSVDDIRTLNEQVRIPPAHGIYKLFIIDEVHMLSTAAFNAFLKTLEEPPSFAIFILATTEKHKILPTILSRCQIYDFKRNKIQDIIPHLEKICQKENLEYDKEALHLIAEKADGALRDALSIFDRMVSFSAGHISYESVIEQLNILDYDYYFQLTDLLLSGDLASVYMLFDQILEKGFSPEVFLLGFQEHLRQLLMVHLGKTATLVHGSEQLQKRYTSQAHRSSRDFLLTILDMANECDVNYRMAQNKRLHVEISLMKMAYFPHATLQKHSFPEAIPAGDTKKNSSLAGSSKKSYVDPSSHRKPQAKITPKNNTQSKTDPKPVAPDTSHPDSVEIPNEQPFESTIHPDPASSKIMDKTIRTKSPKFKRKSKPLLPTLDAMDEILEEVEKDREDSKFILDENEMYERVQEVWKDYSENNSSPSLVTYLKDAKLEWKESKLHILVTSQLAKSSILDQRPLFEKLREATSPHIPEIVFDIEQRDEDELKTPKILSTRDKYEALRNTNPMLDNLIKELNLKFED